LLDESIAAGGRNHLPMVDLLKGWKFSDGSPVTGQLVGTDRLRDVEFAEQASQERFCRFGIAVALQQDALHDPVLVHGSPEPVADTTDGGTDFVHVPPGTLSGFPVTQLFSDKRREFDVPRAKRVVADLKTTLLKQFLHISVTEREAMVQPNRVLDDADRDTVAVGLTVSHWPPPYWLTCQNPEWSDRLRNLLRADSDARE